VKFVDRTRQIRFDSGMKLKGRIEARIPWPIHIRMRREAAARHLFPADILREILVSHYARQDAAALPVTPQTQAAPHTSTE
jgi:hypothetical protein